MKKINTKEFSNDFKKSIITALILEQQQKPDADIFAPIFRTLFQHSLLNGSAIEFLKEINVSLKKVKQ